MDWFIEIGRQPWAQRLGWVLAHFIWQGLAAAVLLGLALMLLRRRSAQMRYAAACAALSLMAVLPLATAWCLPAAEVRRPALAPVSMMFESMPPAQASPASPVDAAEPDHVASAPRTINPPPAARGPSRVVPAEPPAPASWLQPALSAIVLAWLTGVLILSLLHLVGWLRVQRLRRRHVHPAGPAVEHALERLAGRMGIRRTIRILESALTQVPAVIGTFRPVVLIPASALSGLAPAQLEAILAHELAHIRRHDYLVNLLQSVVETVLFYHPAVWWVSSRIRQEREHCCDDVATRACGDRLTYARALAVMEELRAAGPRLAIAASGGALLPRIRRILGLQETHSHGRTWSLAAACLAIACLALPWALTQRPAMADPATRPTGPAPAMVLPAPHGTVTDDQGKPVADAEVILYYNHNHWGLGNHAVQAIRTDVQGRFRFTAELPFEQLSGTDYTDHYILFARHPDHAIGWDLIFSGTADVPHELVLTEPQSQSFHVTDRDGKPLAGVRVGLYAAGRSEDKRPAFRRPFHVGTEAGIASALTDEQGNATLTNLPATSRSFRTTQVGYGPAWVMSSKAGGNIRLSPSARVSGTVRDNAGRGIPNAVVSFGVTRSIHQFFLARTDEQGHYFVELIGKGGFSFGQDGGDGEYTVTIQHPDYTSDALPLIVQPGEVIDGMDVIVTPGVLVKGKVLEPGTSRPLPGARVQADNKVGRLNAYADANGEFRWRVLPGDLTSFFLSPPGGTYVNDPEHRRSWQNTPIADDQAEVALTIYAPSAVGKLVTLRGKVVQPDGQPAVGIVVRPELVASGIEMASSSGYVRPTPTGPDGSFIFQNMPAGQKLNLYAETKGRVLLLTATISVSDKPDQDAGQLAMRPGESADILLTDAEGKPLAGMAIKMEPSFGDNTVSGAERTVRTDPSGHLKVAGVARGLPYLLRDARWDRSDSEWSDSFHTVVTLLPENGPSEPVILSTLLPIRVVDSAGKAIPIKDVDEVRVAYEKSYWTLGPKPEIKQRLEDGWVLIDRQFVVLAKPGARVDLMFTTEDGSEMTATGQFPAGNASRIQFAAGAPPEVSGVQMTGGPADVAADEVAGRVVDPAGRPVGGATVSFPRGLPQLPPCVPPTTTDADGVFRFPGFGKTHYMYMQVEKPGYARRWITDLPIGKSFSVLLDNTTGLKGQLLLPDGTPAAGARITPVTTKPTSRRNMGDISNLQFDVQADDLGRYNILLEPGEYDVRITAPGGYATRHEHVRLNLGESRALPQTVEKGAAIRIKCVDTQTQQPVAGVTLDFEKHLPGASMPHEGTQRTTDAAGVAEWSGLVPGLTSLGVHAPGYARWGSTASPWRKELDINSVALDVRPNAPEVTVNMEPGMRLTGKVVDATGNPVPKAWVNVEGLQTGDWRYMRPTNAQGEFDLTIPGRMPGAPSMCRLVVMDMQTRQPLARSDEFAPKVGGQESFTLTLP